jgi:hypothetical protein
MEELGKYTWSNCAPVGRIISRVSIHNTQEVVLILYVVIPVYYNSGKLQGIFSKQTPGEKSIFKTYESFFELAE